MCFQIFSAELLTFCFFYGNDFFFIEIVENFQHWHIVALIFRVFSAFAFYAAAHPLHRQRRLLVGPLRQFGLSGA